MASEVNNKGQAQQSPQAGQQGQQGAMAQPLTLQGEETSQKETYLKAHQWRKIGVGAFARWKDPSKPMVDTYSKPGEGRKVMTTNRNGQQVQVMAQAGQGREAMMPVEQVIMTPAGKLMTLDEAVSEQAMRDYEKEMREQDEIQRKEHEEAKKKLGLTKAA